jgi:hypothetical protein
MSASPREVGQKVKVGLSVVDDDAVADSGADVKSRRLSNGSGSGSGGQYDYFMCNYIKKNGQPCRRPVVKIEEVVCHEHLADALASMSALVSLRELVRDKLINPRKNTPFTSASAVEYQSFMDAYISALRDAYLHGQGFGVAGGSYTYESINVFDVAFSIGVKIDSSDMRVYNELVRHRADSINQQLAYHRDRIEYLSALKANYTPISVLEAQLASASALQFKPVDGDDAVMEDRADSD